MARRCIQNEEIHLMVQPLDFSIKYEKNLYRFFSNELDTNEVLYFQNIDINFIGISIYFFSSGCHFSNRQAQNNLLVTLVTICNSYCHRNRTFTDVATKNIFFTTYGLVYILKIKNYFAYNTQLRISEK